MTALPDNISFGKVRGRFGSPYLSAGDADGLPDFQPLAGLEVTFTPTPDVILNLGASPVPITFLTEKITCTLDDDGYLIGPDGREGVNLIATDDTDLSPNGWTYSVSFGGNQATYKRLATFTISVPAGSTRWLTSIAPVPSSSGSSTLDEVQAAVLQMGVAVGQAQSYASQAATSASQAATSATSAAASASTAAPKTSLYFKPLGVDDTAALQALINSVNVGLGAPTVTIQVLPGTVKLTDTVTINRRSVLLRGMGRGNSPQSSNPGMGTRITWGGASNIPMFKVTDSRYVLFEDMAIVGHNTNVPSECIFYESISPGSVGTNSQLELSRIAFGKTLENTTNWQANYFVRFGGLNANNDQFHFKDCEFTQPVTAGLQIDQTQSIWGLLTNCFFQGNFTARGIRTNSSMQLTNASFDSCLVDFEVSPSLSGAQVVVNGWYSERSIKPLLMPMHNGRFQATGGLVAIQTAAVANGGDGYFIDVNSLQADGALSLDGVKFYLLGTATRPKIRVRAPAIGAVTGGHVVIRNSNLQRADLDLTCANNRGIFVAWDDDHLFNRSDVINGGTWSPIDSLSGATRADSIRRREAMQSRTRRAAGQWYIKRTSSTEYHFIRSLGQGMYIDQPLKQAAGVPTAVLGGTSIGFPMLAADEGAATYAGTWVQAIAASATSGYTPLAFTASVNATTRVLTVTSGISLTTGLHAGRRITIPGGGAAGASLDVTLASVTNSTTGVLNIATATDLANVTVTMWPGYRFSTTAGSTASWTTPVASTSLGVIICKVSNGGLMKVSVDGSSTAANLLPTAQDVVTSGLYANTILVANGGTLNPTDRVLSTYAAATDYSSVVVIATGLASATHTILVSCTGYSPVGQTGGRSYLTGFCYATGAETPLTAGTLLAATSLLGASSSAWEYAYSHQPSGLANDYAGSIHGYETAVSLSTVIDGLPVTMADGEIRVVANEASIIRVTQLNHINAPTTVYANITTTYRINSTGLVINHVDRWVQPTTVVTGYTAMVPTNGYIFDTFQFDTESAASTAVLGNNAQLGKQQTSDLVAWDQDGTVAIGISIVAPEVASGNWSKPFENLWFQDRSPSGGEKYNKAYLSRAGTVAAGDIWSAEWIVSWSYFPEGANKYFPV